MKLERVAESEKDWAAFVRKYRAEMADPEKSRILDLLAALSHDANFSVGCYCRMRRAVTGPYCASYWRREGLSSNVSIKFQVSTFDKNPNNLLIVET